MIFAANAVNAQTNIHSIDFKNFTYLADCAGEKPEKITVKDGEFSKETKTGDYTEHMSFDIMSVTYGDLNGDKQDEAVILSVCNTGGTGQFTEGFIYTMKGGKPTLVASVPGGDRADGGLRSLKVENGLLVVDANDESENSGACCPEFAIITKYRLTNDKLVKAGEPIRRDLYPTERIVFAKGASAKSFTIKIVPDDLRRFVIGARADQVLTVTVNTDKASIRLLGYETMVTEGTNRFSIKLEKNGDYII